MARRKKSYYKKLKKASPQSIILAIIFLILAVAGYYIYNKYFKEEEPFIEAKGAISFHFMTLGNGASGDCTFIKAGDNDILIDAGSSYDSKQAIMDYINPYMEDNKLEFVIATHAHEDHIACFAGEENKRSLFDEYECGIIIDFPKTNADSKVYNRYVSERDAEVAAGATHYTALECYNNDNGAKRVYELSEDGSVKMEILYNPYYEKTTSNENNYSVCVQFSHGSERLFLFTGDLEEGGEQDLVDNNNLKKVKLFKAGHHGSNTASNLSILSVIQPEIFVISGAAGDKYGFPHQETIDRIANYTKKVYITTLADTQNSTGYEPYHGNIMVVSDETEGVTVSTTHNKNLLLKDTAWFIKNRTMPDAWKSAA